MNANSTAAIPRRSARRSGAARVNRNHIFDIDRIDLSSIFVRIELWSSASEVREHLRLAHLRTSEAKEHQQIHHLNAVSNLNFLSGEQSSD